MEEKEKRQSMEPGDGWDGDYDIEEAGTGNLGRFEEGTRSLVISNSTDDLDVMAAALKKAGVPYHRNYQVMTSVLELNCLGKGLDEPRVYMARVNPDRVNPQILDENPQMSHYARIEYYPEGFFTEGAE